MNCGQNTTDFYFEHVVHTISYFVSKYKTDNENVKQYLEK